MTGAGFPRPPLRASDADREHAVRLLRQAVVEGRLAHESFVRRVELALTARDRESLGSVTADLSPTRERDLAALARWLLRPAARARPLRLPRDRWADYCVGRSHACDLVLHEPSVSRLHAALRCFGDQWFVEDLGSTNGTRVNGFRVHRSVPVEPGDLIDFGGVLFQVRPSHRR